MFLSKEKSQVRQFLVVRNPAYLEESSAAPPDNMAGINCLLVTWRLKLIETLQISLEVPT